MKTHKKMRREDDWRRALASLGVAVFEKQRRLVIETAKAVEEIVEGSKRGTTEATP